MKKKKKKPYRILVCIRAVSYGWSTGSGSFSFFKSSHFSFSRNIGTVACNLESEIASPGEKWWMAEWAGSEMWITDGDKWWRNSEGKNLRMKKTVLGSSWFYSDVCEDNSPDVWWRGLGQIQKALGLGVLANKVKISK